MSGEKPRTLVDEFVADLENTDTEALLLLLPKQRKELEKNHTESNRAIVGIIECILGLRGVDITQAQENPNETQ